MSEPFLLLVSRVRQLLNDPEDKRFPDDLLTCAIRQALELIDVRLPQTATAEITVETSGRDQALGDLDRLPVPGRHRLSLPVPGLPRT